jgi:integrase
MAQQVQQMHRRFPPWQARPSPTVTREIITPLRAVLQHAHKRYWCDPPRFIVPGTLAGRTLFMSPDDAERLIAAAAPHLRPELVFLSGTGTRLSEAICIEWRDVDLTGARAIFRRTKNERRRVAALLRIVIVSLANIPKHEGCIFSTPGGDPYAEHRGKGGRANQNRLGGRHTALRAQPRLHPTYL